MLENASDPPMDRHRPASGESQEISYLLASIFKDVYTSDVIGKDTVANLTKSRQGGNRFQDRYVEELQKARAEYGQRLRDADVLEKHIVQARVRATAAEERTRSRMLEDLGGSYHQVDLPAVRSAFKCCVDNHLLKSNHLICPEDYITEQVPYRKPPQGKSAPGFANPTTSYVKHTCNLPQDDGFAVISPQGGAEQNLLDGSETTMTFTSSSQEYGTKTSLPTPSQKPAFVRKSSWKRQPNTKRRAEEREDVLKLKERQNFLRNPRFLTPSAERGCKSLILSKKMEESKAAANEALVEERPEASVPIFLANPAVVFFTDYSVGQVYETTIALRNMTAISQHVRVIPPASPYFSIGLGKFPGEGGIVAAGMCCQYTVRFAPDSLEDYEDFIVVETRSCQPLIVPVEARRPPPILTLPAELDCGYCLVGGVKFIEVLCQNEGFSAGTFCIMPRKQWPAFDLKSVVKASYAEGLPFAVCPSLFELLPGQATVLEVVFFPSTAELFSQDFTIVCDNCHVKHITLQGQGQMIALDLVSVTGGEDLPAVGELRDVTANHFVRFGSTNPYSVLRKKMVIRNNGHIELPFHWSIMKPILQQHEEGADLSYIQRHIATDNAFLISPASGILKPLEDHEFLLTYHPQRLIDYHSLCHLVIINAREPPRQVPEEGAAQTIETEQMCSEVVMEVEVKGSTEPYKVLLEPCTIILSEEIYVHTTMIKTFKMWNHSKSVIRFEWECTRDCHTMEVEPPTGEIVANDFIELSLAITGGKPEHFSSVLFCHVQHYPQPLGLHINATFKGPELTIDVPSVDLGLMGLGEETDSRFNIINHSHLEAQWSLDQHSTSGQLVLDPREGLLAPFASCKVKMFFKALLCQNFESNLELVVKEGTGCKLLVKGDVQGHDVCLLSCEMVFPNLYVGVPETSTVTIFNQTQLPAHFRWGPVFGKQASLCTASFVPASGTLASQAKLEVMVSFTAHTDEEITGISAVCEVKEMENPPVLHFSSKAKPLSVSYSLPDSANSSALVLDFGDKLTLGVPVTRTLKLTNETAIPASFSVEAEYFKAYRPSESQFRHIYMRRPLHSVQAKKIEEKAYDDFVKDLLSLGKGAVLFVQPDSGTLGPFQTHTINITAFTNMWGDYQDLLICKAGDLEPTCIPVQMAVRGCPLYFQMTGPHPEKQNEGPIIRFGTHMSGGDTVSRSLRLNNTSPYDIRVDWETFNWDPLDRKLLDMVVACGEPFPLKDADGNEVVGRRLSSSENSPPTWDRSHTPSSKISCSSLSTVYSEPTGDHLEEEQIMSPFVHGPERKLFSVFLRAHEGNASDYPFCITPQQIVVPAGGCSIMHVSFTPLSLSDQPKDSECLGFALGFMSLDSRVASCVPGKVERAQGYRMEPLRLDLQASVKPATLLVQMEDDEKILKFWAVASNLIEEEDQKEATVVARTIQLKNLTEMPLCFRLSCQPPFSVLQPRAVSRTGSSHGQPAESQPLRLPPQHNMQVKVGFHSSVSLLDYVNRRPEELPPSVTLVCGDSGEKNLCFHQTLILHFTNNSVQMVPLLAHLALPALRLSSDNVDFGICHVGQPQIKEVHLYNQGGSSSSWNTFIEASGRGVFRVRPDCGVLKPMKQSGSSQPLQICFTASDQEEFTAIITIRGMLGEASLRLQVVGRGSLDEKHIHAGAW
ncbi:deleted in lung and esophageal cancer protein 1 isoform X2 [Denticeps clupeoides]|uniref:deleted in lung and esophageal cancer protein 1 isoform X2 n=1 Tax=Denticeps clupeoides TaxID=299321 RepID=UPI0010A56217|nr:deleted in lung and esophageal cancer protein 1 isoform X2 [Denticeps clupeoides]